MELRCLLPIESFGSSARNGFRVKNRNAAGSDVQKPAMAAFTSMQGRFDVFSYQWLRFVHVWQQKCRWFARRFAIYSALDCQIGEEFTCLTAFNLRSITLKMLRIISS